MYQLLWSYLIIGLIRLKKMNSYASLQQQQRPQISWKIYSTLTTQVKKHMKNSTLTDCKAIHLDWNFHDPLSKNKLKTLSNLVKKKKAISNGGAVMLKTDMSLFGRIIIIAQSGSLGMRDVFAHPLGPLPWSLANPDATPRKTAKSDQAFDQAFE